MKPRGIYVSPTEFVQFAEPGRHKSLTEAIATRDRRPDFTALGMLLPNPDPVLKKQGKDVSVYRELRSDAHVGGCVRRRKAAVKALEWRLVRGKAGARTTRLCEDVIGSLALDRFVNEALDAVLYGWQPMEITWGRPQGAMVPVKIEAKPSEWFHFDSEAQLRFRSRQAPLWGEALEPRKFLVPAQEASYANPYGHADLSMCFWPTVFKRGGLKFWVTFTERYGTPWLVGKVPRSTSATEQDQLADKLESMIQDAIAVIPDDSSISTVEANSVGVRADMYEQLLMFCRSEVSIALLGQNQSTEANSNRASAVAGLEVTRDIRDGDARLVEATVDQLLRWVVDLSEGEGAPAPKFELFEEEDVDTAQAERDEKLQRAGVKFTPAYWKRVYKLEDGDIEDNPQPPPPALPVPAHLNAAFAEAPGAEAELRDLVARLGQAGAPVVDGWLQRLGNIVAAHDEPAALQEALLEAFGDMPTDDLVDVMGLAFELAELQGRERAQQEAGNG